jgi:hypothetical protein
MGYNIAAYVERKDKETGKWVLATERPISSYLKYIFDDFKEYPTLGWEELSEGLQNIYKREKDESTGEERCYASFYTKTTQELEDAVSANIHDAYTKLNMIVKALGCSKVYSDDGEELEPWGDDEQEKMTLPINKGLVEDLQYGYEAMRNIGQKEAIDLVLSEYTEYGEGYRVVFVLT